MHVYRGRDWTCEQRIVHTQLNIHNWIVHTQEIGWCVGNIKMIYMMMFNAMAEHELHTKVTPVTDVNWCSNFAHGNSCNGIFGWVSTSF